MFANWIFKSILLGETFVNLYLLQIRRGCAFCFYRQNTEKYGVSFVRIAPGVLGGYMHNMRNIVYKYMDEQ